MANEHNTVDSVGRLGEQVLERAHNGQGAVLVDLSRSQLIELVLSNLPLDRAEDVIVVAPHRDYNLSLIPAAPCEHLRLALRALDPTLVLSTEEIAALDVFARWSPDHDDDNYIAIKPKLVANRALALLWRMVEEIDFGSWDCKRGRPHELHAMHARLLPPLLTAWADPIAAALLYGNAFPGPTPTSLIFVEQGALDDEFVPMLLSLAFSLLPRADVFAAVPTRYESAVRLLSQKLGQLGGLVATNDSLDASAQITDSWPRITCVEQVELLRELSRLKYAANSIQFVAGLYKERGEWEAPKALLDGEPALAAELISRCPAQPALAERLMDCAMPSRTIDFDVIWRPLFSAVQSTRVEGRRVFVM